MVVGACSFGIADSIPREGFQKAGLNPHLLEQVDIREQCAWVHPSRESATEKAASLVKSGIDRCLRQESLEDLSFAVTGAALVVGRTKPAVQAAKRIAEAGFEVYLVDEAIEPAAEELDQSLSAGHDNVVVLKNARIEAIDGVFGLRHVKALTDEGAKEFDVGTILVSASVEEQAKNPFGYPHSDASRLMTAAGFENLLVEQEQKMRSGLPIERAPPNCIDFVQSNRDFAAERNLQHVQSAFTALAVSQALRFKRLCPSTEIRFFFHDAEGLLRTCKALSDSAARSGIHFNSLESPAEVIVDGEKTFVRALHADKGQIDTESDLIVIVGDRTASGVTPGILELLHIGTGEGRTVSEPSGHRASDLNRGIFVIRTSSSDEAVEKAEADAAASAMIDMMRQGTVRIPRRIARVQEDRCRGCGKCMSICEHNAIELVHKGEEVQIARVDELRCEGCGICRVACCNGAMALLGYTTTQMLAQMMGMIGEAGE